MTTHSLKLMIPGPVDVGDDVLDALARPPLPHYGPLWMPVYQEAIERLQWLFGTRHTLFMIPGPGSAAFDAALGSMMRTGDKVVIAANGFFGRRNMAIARGYGLEVCSAEGPLDRPLDPDDLRRRLLSEGGVRALAVVHLETSTGVLNPLREIAAVAREVDVPLLVDAVSSLGGVPLPVDEWGIDVCVTVVNKCLACPPALAPISIGPRAWEQIDRAGDTHHGWYLDLRVWRDYAARWGAWHPTPTTLPTNNIVATLASLRQVAERGLEAHYRQFSDAAAAVRAGLRRLGFELFTDEAYTSPLITAVRARTDLDIEKMRQYLLEEWGIMVSGGLDDLHGRIFRIGHIGRACSPEYVRLLLGGIEAYLRLAGLRPDGRE
ncbi:MAG TPA: alanine--glyoxylate aminotransferase family protein [Anaerolineae bacterium]|nr:alanine--glyoxylate aminotransferase family protein [Anaerolineae bacterium]